MHDRNEHEGDPELREAYTSLKGSEAARQALLARLGRERRAPGGSRARWLAPTWAVSPAQAVAALALALGLGVGAGTLLQRLPHARPPLAVAVRAPAEGVAVTFVLRAPGASRVTVAGDFNGWDAEATPLERANSGDTWTAHVRVPPGLHYYSFVLDHNEWRPDPGAPLSPLASFGRRNSVLVVGEEARL